MILLLQMMLRDLQNQQIQYGGTFERYIVDNLQSSDNAENHLDHKLELSNMMLDFQSFTKINLN